MAAKPPVSLSDAEGKVVLLKTIEDKKRYFNQYWRTRDLPSADTRSQQRAELVESLLSAQESKELLDVGCGRGMVMTFLAEQGYSVEGCDLATDTIAGLRADGYEVFIFDIEQDDLPKKYDGILCLEVLQQVFDPVAALHKFSRSLNNDGCLIVSVPNEFHLWSRMRLLFGKSHLGRFDESHIRLFTPARARELFDLAGMSIEKVISVPIFPPGLKIMGGFGSLLSKFLPSLFSLSQIYRLKPR
jgi:SAM-dependent methyltransferase